MTSDETKTHVTVDIRECARCGECHQQITFIKLQRPCDELTHWAECPVSGEPIMMFVGIDEDYEYQERPQ